MRLCKIVMLILTVAFTLEGDAQNKFGFGVSTAIFPAWNPGLPVSPYLFYRHNNHEVIAGVNIYGGQLGFGSIIGAEAEYRYHYHYFNHLDLFADVNFQYVRFAVGPARDVPFNYQEQIAPNLHYSMVQMRVFNNTLGIGAQYSFWKICALYFNAGIGYHYYRNTISEGVSPSQVNDDLLGSGFKFGYMGKVGLSVALVGRKNNG